MACLAAKPVVDGLEREWAEGRITRLDISSPAGGDTARRYGFEFTPTFILLAGDGSEVRRWVGRPPSLAELRAAPVNPA